MAIMAELVSNEITTISYNAFSEVQVGDNDDYLFGTAEYRTGSSDTNNTEGQWVWDSNPDDGIDSGWQTVAFHESIVNGQSQIEWSIAGLDPIIYNGSSYSNISSVKIRAAVQTQAAMFWRSLSVTFYDNDRRDR